MGILSKVKKTIRKTVKTNPKKAVSGVIREAKKSPGQNISEAKTSFHSVISPVKKQARKTIHFAQHTGIGKPIYASYLWNRNVTKHSLDKTGKVIWRVVTQLPGMHKVLRTVERRKWSNIIAGSIHREVGAALDEREAKKQGLSKEERFRSQVKLAAMAASAALTFGGSAVISGALGAADTAGNVVVSTAANLAVQKGSEELNKRSFARELGESAKGLLIMSDRVKWSGGKAGDISDTGVPYGSLESDRATYEAAFRAGTPVDKITDATDTTPASFAPTVLGGATPGYGPLDTSYGGAPVVGDTGVEAPTSINWVVVGVIAIAAYLGWKYVL